jgi:hypothetical protein
LLVFDDTTTYGLRAFGRKPGADTIAIASGLGRATRCLPIATRPMRNSGMSASTYASKQRCWPATGCTLPERAIWPM